VIISEFPGIFAEFHKKRFSLLWRGSRNSFDARCFHNRCDKHPNTLTVILDTDGNIFGGFTPVKWESPTFGKYKGDPSLKSFLFTLKNPHNVPARTIALKAEAQHAAIECNGLWGPCFYDICVCHDCDIKIDSWSNLGYNSYTNDTGLDGKTNIPHFYKTGVYQRLSSHYCTLFFFIF
jgi:hypothetical protein